MTRMGADVRQIARLLQAKAPEGHMLAYITPEEAELLKSQGGSGKPHADTGVPSFEVFSEGDYAQMNQPVESPIELSSLPPVTNVETPAFSADKPAASFDASQFAAPPSVAPAPIVAQTPSYAGDMSQYAGAFPVGSFESQPGTSITPYQIDTTPEKGVVQRLSEATGMSKESLARLGIAGGLGAYGAYQSKKALNEAKKAKEEQQRLAAPYRQQGAELQRAAQAGELTPQAAQALQAVQAQTAQQASNRGGVGTMQTQAQVEAFRQQLLTQQYDYGLKLSGIADNIALGAIKTGLEADRYVQNLSNSFYSNMANIAGGMPAQAPQQYRNA